MHAMVLYTVHVPCIRQLLTPLCVTLLFVRALESQRYLPLFCRYLDANQITRLRPQVFDGLEQLDELCVLVCVQLIYRRACTVTCGWRHAVGGITKLKWSCARLVWLGVVRWSGCLSKHARSLSSTGHFDACANMQCLRTTAGTCNTTRLQS